MKPDRRVLDLVTTVLAVGILVAAIPEALRDTLDSGRIYLFSSEFLADIPARFSGPGKMRFILQPAIAIILGLRGGIGDYRAGRAPYLHGLLFGTADRRVLIREGLRAVRSLVAMGIVADAISQWLIYGIMHPGAALVIGPVLICVPYALTRALTCRFMRVAGAR